MALCLEIAKEVGVVGKPRNGTSYLAIEQYTAAVALVTLRVVQRGADAVVVRRKSLNLRGLRSLLPSSLRASLKLILEHSWRST
jgi:hypothetical protein